MDKGVSVGCGKEDVPWMPQDTGLLTLERASIKGYSQLGLQCGSRLSPQWMFFPDSPSWLEFCSSQLGESGNTIDISSQHTTAIAKSASSKAIRKDSEECQ